MSKVAIVIPTWNNLQYLIQAVRSLKQRTKTVHEYRLIVVPNGCTDSTQLWLNQEKMPFKELPKNAGFVVSTNVGLDQVEPDEHVLLLNDDTRITDPDWLDVMVEMVERPEVGAVGPVSNYVMGVQDFRLDNLPDEHEAPFLIGFCMLIKNEAFKKVGKLDEAFGMGTNDDLDYSMSLKEAGYKLLISRKVFVWHYGARSIYRLGKKGQDTQEIYDELQVPTRETLKKKWGVEKTAAMLLEMRGIIAVSKTGRGMN